MPVNPHVWYTLLLSDSDVGVGNSTRMVSLVVFWQWCRRGWRRVSWPSASTSTWTRPVLLTRGVPSSPRPSASTSAPQLVIFIFIIIIVIAIATLIEFVFWWLVCVVNRRKIEVCFRPDVIRCGRLDSEYQLTNQLTYSHCRCNYHQCHCPHYHLLLLPCGLTFTKWKCCGLCFWNKPAGSAHSFLFCYCVYFCLYGPFNRISFHKFSLQLPAQLPPFSLCSSGLISTLLVLWTISIHESLLQPCCNPLWLTGLKAPTN